MQVSQMSDSVTHAVIGKKESREMGISDSAALMHIFSTALYTYPQLATVREIICNGWDGHIVEGKTDVPLQITVKDGVLRIRDFGPGIPDEKMGPIYGVFGNSSKRDDETVTGGFGLGSKAPFAYTDNFEVISHHNGVKSVYRISKSSMERGGKPTIDTMVQLPTEETGIQVSIQLKSHSDHQRFMTLIKEVLILGEIKACINGEPEVETLPLSQSHTGFIIQSFEGTLTERINLRYGNVVYPVPRNEHYAEMWDQITRCVSNLWDSANVIFMAPPNGITIAPSREALIFTEATEETIKQLLMKFNPEDAKVNRVYQKQLTKYQANKLIMLEKPATKPVDLFQHVTVPALKGTSNEIPAGPYAFELRKAAINWMLSRRDRDVRGEDLLLKRLRHAIHAGTVSKTLGNRFYTAISKYGQGFKASNSKLREPVSFLQAALSRNVTCPLVQKVAAAEFMDLENLRFVEQAFTGHIYKLVNPLRYKVRCQENLVAFLYPRVLLARSKKAINEFMDWERRKPSGSQLAGWVVYQLPVSDKHHADIKAFFSGMGYQVHSYVPAPVVKEVDPNAPVKVAAPKKVSPKRKGYLTLTSAKNSQDEFLISHAREMCKPEDHVKKPIAYVVLSTQSGRPRMFGDMSPKICMAIYKLFGDQVAVVTANQIEKLEAEGVISVSKYVQQHVDDKLSSNPEFPRYLAFTKHFSRGNRYGRAEGTDGIIRNMLLHKELMDTLPEIAGKKFRFNISAETEMLVTFFEDDSYEGFKKKMPKCLLLETKVKKSPMVLEVHRCITNSPWRAYIDLDMVGQMLQNKVPGDADLEVPYEIVRNLLK